MKTNQQYFTILVLTVASFTVSYSQETATVSGGNATGVGGSSSYSIGQTNYISQNSSSWTVTLGVQQPYEIVTLGIDDYTEINLTMSAYPNPTTDLLNLLVNADKWTNLTYQLFDTSSKTASSLQKIKAPETNISMQELQRGIYFLVINTNGRTIKTFKIIKK